MTKQQEINTPAHFTQKKQRASFEEFTPQESQPAFMWTLEWGSDHHAKMSACLPPSVEPAHTLKQ